MGKARPKAPKTKAPTRPAILNSTMPDANGDQKDMQEGLDDFFGAPGSAPMSPISSPAIDDR
jgi:hypothetical protein